METQKTSNSQSNLEKEKYNKIMENKIKQLLKQKIIKKKNFKYRKKNGQTEPQDKW